MTCVKPSKTDSMQRQANIDEGYLYRKPTLWGLRPTVFSKHNPESKLISNRIDQIYR